jgi:hypothetical protein
MNLAETTPQTIALTRAELAAAAQQGLLRETDTEPLWQYLVQASRAAAAAARPAPASQGARFSFTDTLYYFGGMLAIGAATLFMTEGWRLLGAWGLLAISGVYAALCVAASQRLHRRGFAIPAGILATLAVCLVPLATWALQQALGLWPEGGPERYASYHTLIDWRWLTLELATLAAAVTALWALRYPFLTMPLAMTLWYLSMDLARLLVAPGEALAWAVYRDFSVFFGLCMLLLAFWVDARSRGAGGSRRDYAFWLYLMGMLTFWGALTARESGDELAKLVYGLFNAALVLLAAVLQRRVFAVCGGLGVALYLGHLSQRVFRDSLLFPLSLTLIGLAVMACGLWWQKHEAQVQAALLRRLPAGLRGWLPAPQSGW